MNTENRDPDTELQEQLSAFCDGELAADSRRFLLKRLFEDAELKQRWSRTHLIGDALRRQACAPLPAGFADRVQACIAAERASGLGHGLARWVGGGAVAAAVALVAILAVPAPGAPSVPAGVAEVAPSGLREQDLRPDLSRATHVVAGGQVASYPQLQPSLGMPMRYVPVLQADGRLLLIPYTPLMQTPAALEPLNPPLLPAQAR